MDSFDKAKKELAEYLSNDYPKDQIDYIIEDLHRSVNECFAATVFLIKHGTVVIDMIEGRACLRFCTVRDKDLTPERLGAYNLTVE